MNSFYRTHVRTIKPIREALAYIFRERSLLLIDLGRVPAEFSAAQAIEFPP